MQPFVFTKNTGLTVEYKLFDPKKAARKGTGTQNGETTVQTR